MPQPPLKPLIAKLQPTLDALHRDAATLADQMRSLDNQTRPWQHFLLKPDFAADAANQLLAHSEQPFDNPFSLAGTLFAQLSYSDEMASGDARNTLQIPGLLAVPTGVIELAQALNVKKAEFQQLTSAIKDALAPRPALERDRILRDLLADAGYPRAHLRHCYRQILLCPEKPDAIALSWIKARKSIKKVSVDWCERKLIQLDPQGQDAGIQYQRQLLAGLHNTRHDCLRQVQIQSRPNLQVAEIFRMEKEEIYRQVGYSAMPVLVQGGETRELPDFTRVDHHPPVSRRRTRKDLKIEPTPFLAALRVHLIAKTY
ncbi:hypothetical protein [Microbulbifer pacificus]|uniref:hypothetical protein n=1 Tax=Microbulbifer pacificus TaxID=407164 RepID=UPI0018F870C6|nr:hypothetical protein [Microbulbifer pacificus]